MAGTAPDFNDPNANVPTAPGIGSAVAPSSPDSSEDGPQYTIDINPNSPPPQKTLVYSPDIQIMIARGNKQYDVSKDIVACSVQRNENAVSTLVFKLSNKDKRYNQLFERMDRVVCLMKRVTWIQIFSGYLDRTPYIQIYPGTVTFKASCTLKRILHTYWDPGLPASIKIFDQAGLHANEQANGENPSDTGLGSLLRRFLVEVGGWDPSNVHIQRFPQSYYLFMQDQLKKSTKGTEQSVAEFKHLMLGDDISLGTWSAAGRQAGVSQGSYNIPQGDRQLEVIRTVDQMGFGPDIAAINASQGLGQSASKSADNKDKPAWTEQQEVTSNWENYGKESDAAIHCFMTILVESNFQMLANNAVPESLTYPHDGVGSDHTSVGLYQQTEGNGWGTVAQRMNVQSSTEMFLTRLNGINWRNMDRGTAVSDRAGFGLPGALRPARTGRDRGGAHAAPEPDSGLRRLTDHRPHQRHPPGQRAGRAAHRAGRPGEHQQSHRADELQQPAGAPPTRPLTGPGSTRRAPSPTPGRSSASPTSGARRDPTASTARG